jgi:hypothetical protein
VFEVVVDGEYFGELDEGLLPAEVAESVLAGQGRFDGRTRSDRVVLLPHRLEMLFLFRTSLLHQ